MAKVLAGRIHTPHVPPMAIPNPPVAPPPPQFVAPAAHSMVGVSVDSVKSFLNHLRIVRDTQAFRAEGAHNFREWTMKQFGDRLGIWLDETL